MSGRLHPGVILLSLVWMTSASAAPLFEDAIAPILESRCVECHSAEKRKGELDLSSVPGFLRGSESGEIFEAGEPEKSTIYKLVHHGEMPKKGDPLTHEQIETIHDWIAEGAHFRERPQLTQDTPNQHDVGPIVLLRCAACHGARLQEGGIDMRTAESMLAGGALVAGDPDNSKMIRRIESRACPPQEKLLKFFVKRPPKTEVAVLRAWIEAGAPVEDIEPDVATSEPDPLVSEEDREHWAFHPPKTDPNAESIDDFIGTRLAAKGLDFSPEADRDTLIRRAYLDLIGMPPSFEESQRWRSGDEKNWYPAMIDHLLASPHYGERWGRYWLDVAGYADSEGGTSGDPVRDVAWKYRDYVVDAFNEDKPYDRFLLEQIAGDELIDVEKAEVITDEMVENLVATGFLRMGMDQTGSRTMNFVPERLGVVGDVVRVLGSGVMGLTMECVKCHTHKYDPIPQRDYYRFKAIFQGALDEHDWMSFKTRKLNYDTPERIQQIAKTNPPLEVELKTLAKKQKDAEADRDKFLLQYHHPELTEAETKTALVAVKKADNQRTLPEVKLVEKFRVAELLPDEKQPKGVLKLRDAVTATKKEIVAVKRRMEPPAAIRALWDRGDPSPTYILRRGEYDKPGRLVGPGVPAVLTNGHTPLDIEPPFPEGTPKTGRRLAFARWLTQPKNPLTARVMVNRIWNHHFGAGIVRTLENFGVQGEKPTHPELLDWLAVEFVEGGWSVKEIHRLMMNSRVYRQSSRVPDKLAEADPENRLFSRMPLRRMDAETLRDSLLLVSGRLDDSPGGAPDPVTVDRDGLVSVDPTPSGGWRRSLYAQYRRTEIPTMLETFDYPEMGPNCYQRSVSTVSPQSLLLTNNGRVRGLSGALAARVDALVVGDGESAAGAAAKVDLLYKIALSRAPTEIEQKLGVEALREISLEAYCHAILNSAAFIYID